MENMDVEEIEPEYYLKCRLCIQQDGRFRIFSSTQKDIHCLFGIMIEPYDGLSQLLCVECVENLKKILRIREQYVENQELLKKCRQDYLRSKKNITQEMIEETSNLFDSQSCNELNGLDIAGTSDSISENSSELTELPQLNSCESKDRGDTVFQKDNPNESQPGSENVLRTNNEIDQEPQVKSPIQYFNNKKRKSKPKIINKVEVLKRKPKIEGILAKENVTLNCQVHDANHSKPKIESILAEENVNLNCQILDVNYSNDDTCEISGNISNDELKDTNSVETDNFISEPYNNGNEDSNIETSLKLSQDHIKTTIKKELETCHESDYICRFCKKELNSFDQVNEHLQDHNEMINLQKQFTPYHCHVKLSTLLPIAKYKPLNVYDNSHPLYIKRRRKKDQNNCDSSTTTQTVSNEQYINCQVDQQEIDKSVMKIEDVPTSSVDINFIEEIISKRVKKYNIKTSNELQIKTIINQLRKNNIELIWKKNKESMSNLKIQLIPHHMRSNNCDNNLLGFVSSPQTDIDIDEASSNLVHNDFIPIIVGITSMALSTTPECINIEEESSKITSSDFGEPISPIMFLCHLLEGHNLSLISEKLEDSPLVCLKKHIEGRGKVIISVGNKDNTFILEISQDNNIINLLEESFLIQWEIISALIQEKGILTIMKNNAKNVSSALVAKVERFIKVTSSITGFVQEGTVRLEAPKMFSHQPIQIK